MGSISPESLIKKPSRWGLPELCAIAQVAGPAILYLPGTQVFRLPLRFSVFATSLLGLAFYLRRGRVAAAHPAWKCLAFAAIYMTLMILHPTTNTTMAGMAQVAMHLAVASPILWAPDYFRGDLQRLARLLVILWALNGASAIVGILQVRDPERWLPAEFSSVETSRTSRISSLSYRTGDNRLVVRPPGLGDAPGAACGAGLCVASMSIIGLGLPISKAKKAAGLAMGMAGVTVIFLTMVRSSLVVLVGCIAVYLAILAMQGRWKAALTICLVSVFGGLGALQYAAMLGGSSVVDRFATLIEEDPMTVYERSARMGMVSDSLGSKILDYPLGAGLGRWGMMRGYFGDDSNLESPGIWSEVQTASWVLDGGIVLVALYGMALFVAIHRLFKTSLNHRSNLVRQWASVVIALSAPPIALIFSWTPFNSQMGIQFWLLIGAFEGICLPVANQSILIPHQQQSSDFLGPSASVIVASNIQL